MSVTAISAVDLLPLLDGFDAIIDARSEAAFISWLKVTSMRGSDRMVSTHRRIVRSSDSPGLPHLMVLTWSASAPMNFS